MWLQGFEKEANARQQEVALLRKTGEAHRRRVKLLELELASQRILAKVLPTPLFVISILLLSMSSSASRLLLEQELELASQGILAKVHPTPLFFISTFCCPCLLLPLDCCWNRSLTAAGTGAGQSRHLSQGTPHPSLLHSSFCCPCLLLPLDCCWNRNWNWPVSAS